MVAQGSIEPTAGRLDILLFDHQQHRRDEKPEARINSLGYHAANEDRGFFRPRRQQRSRGRQIELDIGDDHAPETSPPMVCSSRTVRASCCATSTRRCLSASTTATADRWRTVQHMRPAAGLNNPEQPDELPYTPYRVPVYSNTEGNVSARYVRTCVEAGEAAAGRPMDDAALAVLDRFEEVTKRPDLMLEFTLRPDEMYFINNYTILHARTAFDDGDAEEDRRRHLLRLWLGVPGMRPVHPRANIRLAIAGCLHERNAPEFVRLSAGRGSHVRTRL
jgi:hypothetical protein